MSARQHDRTPLATDRSTSTKPLRADTRNSSGLPTDAEGTMLLRRAADRGRTDLGWLQSYHSFSFGDYDDERFRGYRSLRVINEDRVAPGRGFPMHPHRDMEIISYVLEGSLRHRDSHGNDADITPEEIQMMSAGTGVIHSEFNPSSESPNHFLQIWIEPAQRGLAPRYQERRVGREERIDRWMRIAGPDPETAAVSIRQDVHLYASILSAGAALEYIVEPGRHIWLQVARGGLVVNGTSLVGGDALAIDTSLALHVEATQPSEALLFDLA